MTTNLTDYTDIFLNKTLKTKTTFLMYLKFYQFYFF